MTAAGHFRELEVWKAAMRLAGSVHALAQALDDAAARNAGAAGAASADGQAGALESGSAEAATVDLASRLRRASATIPDHIARGHAADDLGRFADCLATAAAACAGLIDGLQQARERELAQAPALDTAAATCLALADDTARMLARLHQALTRKLRADAAAAAATQR